MTYLTLTSSELELSFVQPFSIVLKIEKIEKIEIVLENHADVTDGDNPIKELVAD